MNLIVLKLTFPDITHVLWYGNVFNGGRLLTCSVSRSAIFSVDCVDACLFLESIGFIEAVKFRPDHSQAAFMGLDSCQRGRNKHTKPNASDAHAWDWKVVALDEDIVCLLTTNDQNRSAK